MDFTLDMVMKSKKEDLLSTRHQAAIHDDARSKLGTRWMRNTSCQLGDADVLIVETTVHPAVSCETTLVGDDTNLLVLLCFHGKDDS